MTGPTAASCDGISCNSRNSPPGNRRRLVRAIGRGVVVGFVILAVGWVAVAAIIIAARKGAALSANPRLEVRVLLESEPARLYRRSLVAAASASKTWLAPAESIEIFSPETFESRWTAAMVPGSIKTISIARDTHERANVATLTPAHPSNDGSDQSPSGIAQSRAGDGAPPVAAATTSLILTPALPRSAPPKQAHNKSITLTGLGTRTAVYDISARTVYLPNGEKLEAHSGLGEKMDDPRFVRIKMHGPTPPNVYDLTLREKLFHGVRAIRLNPTDGSKMFGRDGMLAHTYLLGPSGQSNGCISFKDYSRFLRAYLNGDVNRLVVVSSLRDTPLSIVRAQGGSDWRYASANAPTLDRALTW